MESQNVSSRPTTPKAPSQDPAQDPAEEQHTAPVPCRRCPSIDVVRLQKTRINDNDVYRCTNCGLIFSPAVDPDQTPAPEDVTVIHEPDTGDSPNNPNNPNNFSYEKVRNSYDGVRADIAKRKFLIAHQLGSTIREAARIAGVNPSTLYDWRNKDPEFAKDWLEGRSNLLEEMEVLAFQLALKGDRQLLMFILKSHMPGTYNQRSQQPKGSPFPAAKTIAELYDKVREWA